MTITEDDSFLAIILPRRCQKERKEERVVAKREQPGSLDNSRRVSSCEREGGGESFIVFFSLTSPGAGPRRAGKLAASFSETFVNVQN